MIKIGVAQIANTTSVERNFTAVKRMLARFENKEVDVVLFPECALSGFSARMKECTESVVRPYLEEIHNWSFQTGIHVVLPTAIVQEGQVFNSGFWISPRNKTQFYKLGLTDSEKKFFSVPEESTPKVFSVKGYSFGVLICMEAQLQPWSYFAREEVDAILWPGYWGWTATCQWAANNEEKENLVHRNVKEWQKPLIQSNFAFNDLEGHSGAGPEGLSFVVNSKNELIHRGRHLLEEGFIVQLSKLNGQTEIVSCSESVFS
ncbi:carbon-nitrogen hydrolase family protein [Bdellovibrio svalbardensis]|uniref:Carbon-nitrogen hydrolase family protein n=1 Tax=Bdellovibrio svalbardensis TaxID=2972972 RepID=A0ABT6DHW8_9BACT|nr:carbon-nitrogen hydrolase family protein [Bdellovibrio svalbardensis]MDG0816450.1 carbon-nitrogen hydrolase family protein [Bdellovibrio svalbardensis]